MTFAQRAPASPFATLSANPDDQADSLGNVGMDPAQARALAVIRAARPVTAATRGRDVLARDRPAIGPVYPDRHSAELLQLRADVEAAKIGLTVQLTVGSLAIVVVIVTLIAIAVS